MFLFIVLIDPVTSKCRRGFPRKLLVADDLVLIADTEEELLEWQRGMAKQGLEVNTGNRGKTEVMVSSRERGQR